MKNLTISSAPLLALTGILVAIASINEAYPEISFPHQDFPALEKLVNELDHNEKSLKALESEQSKLQSKISKSKVEYARHSNIVESLEERQQLEIEALRNQLSALQEHIARLENVNEDMRQKLLIASEQSVYGNEKLVDQNERLRDQNRELVRQNRLSKRRLNHLLRQQRNPAYLVNLEDEEELQTGNRDDLPYGRLSYKLPTRYEAQVKQLSEAVK